MFNLFGPKEGKEKPGDALLNLLGKMGVLNPNLAQRDLLFPEKPSKEEAQKELSE